MAVRKVHNKIAAKFVNLPLSEIDEVNRMVDDPIMKQIQLLQEELRNEKEKARKKEEEDFRASMKES